MTIQYTNGKGDTYYLKQSATKTGKVRYTFVKSAASPGLIDEIPEGYEIAESVNGNVNLRKIILPEITEEEQAIVQMILDSKSVEKTCKYDIKGDTITIYYAQVPNIPGALFPGGKSQQKELAQMLLSKARYEPMVKFELADSSSRTFIAYRMCFLGGTMEWMRLNNGDLEGLSREYLPHIGKESFYKLI